MQSKSVLVAVLASLAIAAPGYPHRRGGAAERAVRPRGPSYPVAPPPSPADGYPVEPYPAQPYPASPPASSEAPQGEAFPVTRTTTTQVYVTTTRTTTKPLATPATSTTTKIPESYPQARPTTQPFSILPLPHGYPQSHPTTTTAPGYSLRPTQSMSPPPPADGGKGKNKACGTSMPMCCETTLVGLAGVTCKPSSNKKQSSKDLQKECASTGHTAKCCAATLLNLPVGVVCTEPLKDSK